MKTIIVGSGGREDALSYKISQSSLLDKLYCLPGNGGMAKKGELIQGRIEDAPIVAKELGVDFVIVGPEGPLVDGIVERCMALGIPAFGPDSRGAQLEGSKVFAKRFMKKYGIPTANFEVFSDYQRALAYIEENGLKVIKADGLAAGKGVVIPETFDEARDTLYRFMIEKTLKSSGERVVIEDFLSGREVSCFIITDGGDYKFLPIAQDYKRAYDGNRGPNTGGMGSIAPVELEESLIKKIKTKIVEPTLDGLQRENILYKGVIYFGLILVKDEPYVLEYNVRFGDPETQAIMPLIEGDLLQFMYETVQSRLPSSGLSLREEYSCCVVIASSGYPSHYEIGKEITGIDSVTDALIFHAGTRWDNGRLVTNGGRVLNVVGIGNSLEIARENAYKAIEYIHFDNMMYRRDIGEGVSTDG
ncbi:MAG: phosphoribosylamine--glycine ligase [bacterium]